MARKDWILLFVNAVITLFTGYHAELAPVIHKWVTDLSVWRFLFLLSLGTLAWWMLDKCKRWLDKRFKTILAEVSELRGYIEKVNRAVLAQAQDIERERQLREQGDQSILGELRAFKKHFPEGLQ